MNALQATATAEPVSARASAEPPRLSGPKVITASLIDAVATSGCGWSRKQLKILGVDWPVQSGWRQRLVAEGRSLTAEQVTALYDARKKPKGTEGADDPESPLVPTPCPWCRRLVEPVMQGGRTKEFCCKKHKNRYNAALNRLSLAYARTIRTPGNLKTWAGGRVDLTESGAEGLPRATEGAGNQDTPSAAPRDETS